MPVKSSGSLSFITDIVGEFEGTAPHSLSEYYGVADGVPASGAISFSDFYGKSAAYDLSQELTPTIINGQSGLKQLRASDYISTGGTITISSDLWVWSDSTSTAALIVDVANATIINSGKIIGKGGAPGDGGNGIGGDGGPAIQVTASGVSVINNSGAYIAGGGGAGGGTHGGGGAGGGDSGDQSGGSLNAEGQDASYAAGTGGGAGGGGGGSTEGGAGGRILPGTGGSGSSGGGQSGGNGGSAGNAGSNSGTNSVLYQIPNSQYSVWIAGSAGGGGWGASGGNAWNAYSASSGDFTTYLGGAGGAAITGSSVTLTNNGTIYGST